MARTRLRTMAGLLLALAVPASALGATPSATINVGSVDGKAVRNGAVAGSVRGKVAVTGTASTDAAPPAPAKPLVVDAGDSAYVKVGQPATLIGSAYGGTAPYRWAWSSTVGELQGAAAPSTLLDTAGVAPGTYTVSLQVTDARGRTKSDIVKVAVYRAPLLLDETQEDVTPGAGAGTNEAIEVEFQVPAGKPSIEAVASWTLEANDYDLCLDDPSGAEVDCDAVGVPQTSETVTAQNPVAGTWTLRLIKFATVTDEIHMTVTTTATDPRPAVSTKGPFKFLPGATQLLDGTVTGGTPPYAARWDLDDDGITDATGVDVTANLGLGRHIVSFRVRDAAGFERRETTSVTVGDAATLARTPSITVLGVADSGINPYHLEFSARTYPDPDVLRFTKGFTRHPSEYIPGYPKDAEALPITLDQGYFPARDSALWRGGPNSTIKNSKLYWIPGTKIVGAVTKGVSGSNVAADTHPILDDDGHGTGSASVSTGNRYGYCPTCLLVMVEGLDETVNSAFQWVDIQSNSFGYVGGAPVGPVVGPSVPTKEAVERGQTVLFAAGNGVGNAFDVPIATYGSDQTGNDWNITVGALRRDNQRAVVGDGIPAHISAWGDGNLPSACRTGMVGQCAFGGTSAASPYTAGVFGTVLTKVRQAIGDPDAGQRPGQVVAQGRAIPGSTALADGKLTRAELREAVLKTAYPLNQSNDPSIFPYPVTAPHSGDTNVLFEGYGAATPEGGERAVAVLLGKAVMPERDFEDSFFEVDRQIRDTMYGGYDRDGDGTIDNHGLAAGTLDAIDTSTVEGTMYALRLVTDRYALDPSYALETRGENALTYYLHRRTVAEPDSTVVCGGDHNELFMNLNDANGDIEPCFESRVTSVAAAYRPLGIFPTRATLRTPLPAGSTVGVTMFIASENPTVMRPTGTLVATDREIGTGAGAPGPVLGTGPGPGSNVQGEPLPDGGGCKAAGELCWSKFEWSFETTRHAFTGEQITFQISLVGARAWAFGFEGEHASKVTIVPADLPATGLEFGTRIDSPAAGSTSPAGRNVVAGGRVSFPDLGEDPTGAGDHPRTKRVELSLDDNTFANPITATLHEASGTWRAQLGKLAAGSHRLYSRATLDRTASRIASVAFRVGDTAQVQWQVVRRNAAPQTSAWRTASGFRDWSFAFNAASYATGAHTIVVRVVRDGLELSRSTVKVTLAR